MFVEHVLEIFLENYGEKCANLRNFLFHYQSTRCASYGDRKRKGRQKHEFLASSACSMAHRYMRTSLVKLDKQKNNINTRERMVFISTSMFSYDNVGTCPQLSNGDWCDIYTLDLSKNSKCRVFSFEEVLCFVLF